MNYGFCHHFLFIPLVLCSVYLFFYLYLDTIIIIIYSYLICQVSFPFLKVWPIYIDLNRFDVLYCLVKRCSNGSENCGWCLKVQRILVGVKVIKCYCLVFWVTFDNIRLVPNNVPFLCLILVGFLLCVSRPRPSQGLGLKDHRRGTPQYCAIKQLW